MLGEHLLGNAAAVFKQLPHFLAGHEIGAFVRFLFTLEKKLEFVVPVGEGYPNYFKVRELFRKYAYDRAHKNYVSENKTRHAALERLRKHTAKSVAAL